MRHKERGQAIRLRMAGGSYDEIKVTLGIAKSTLSYWLRDLPLSEKQKAVLQTRSKRTENFRETFRLKRERRLNDVRKEAQKLFGKLSKRDLFVMGISLYWAEGYKTADTTTALANTDPAMIRFFIKWLESLGVQRANLRVRLQLYSDMNPAKEINFWSKVLRLPHSAFRAPYIKTTRFADITYRNGFGHGTCNILYHNRVMNDHVLSLVELIRNLET